MKNVIIFLVFLLSLPTYSQEEVFRNKNLVKLIFNRLKTPQDFFNFYITSKNIKGVIDEVIEKNQAPGFNINYNLFLAKIATSKSLSVLENENKIDVSYLVSLIDFHLELFAKEQLNLIKKTGFDNEEIVHKIGVLCTGIIFINYFLFSNLIKEYPALNQKISEKNSPNGLDVTCCVLFGSASLAYLQWNGFISPNFPSTIVITTCSSIWYAAKIYYFANPEYPSVKYIYDNIELDESILFDSRERRLNVNRIVDPLADEFIRDKDDALRENKKNDFIFSHYQLIKKIRYYMNSVCSFCRDSINDDFDPHQNLEVFEGIIKNNENFLKLRTGKLIWELILEAKKLPVQNSCPKKRKIL